MKVVSEGKLNVERVRRERGVRLVAGHDRIAGHLAADGLLEAQDHAVEPVHGDPDREIGPVRHDLDGARMPALQDHGLPAGHRRRPGDEAAPRPEDVLAVARRVDEQLRQRLRLERRHRAVDARGSRQVLAVRAAHDWSHRPTSADLAARDVGLDRGPVCQPHLVGADPPLGPRGEGPRPARVGERCLNRGDVLSACRGGALLDPHAQGGKAELRVAHEREQVGDRRDRLAQRGDLRAGGAVGGDGEGAGAVPGAGGGHGADCIGRARAWTAGCGADAVRRCPGGVAQEACSGATDRSPNRRAVWGRRSSPEGLSTEWSRAPPGADRV